MICILTLMFSGGVSSGAWVKQSVFQIFSTFTQSTKTTLSPMNLTETRINYFFFHCIMSSHETLDCSLQTGPK